MKYRMPDPNGIFFEYVALGTFICIAIPVTILFSPVFLILGGMGWCIQRLGQKFNYNLRELL